MGYSYLVLGAGVGKAIVTNLAERIDTKLVSLADKDYRAVLPVDRLVSKSSSAQRDYLVLDVMKDTNLEALFGNFNVVISALPAKFSPVLAKAAIAVGSGFCDLGGVLPVTLDLMKLNDSARKAMVSVVPDCGLMPGLGMIMARKLISDMNSVESIEILVGGLPQKPKPPVYYQRVFSLEGLRHLCYDKALILSNGMLVESEPMSDYGLVRIPELEKYNTDFDGTVESFITAGASVMPEALQARGIKNFWEKTIRWPGFVDFVHRIPRPEFERSILEHINIPVSRQSPDLVFMKVTARDRMGKTLSYSLLDEFDPKTGLSAMERTTGFTTASIARYIAKKNTRIGVHTSDAAILDYALAPFLKEVGTYFSIRRS